MAYRFEAPHLPFPLSGRLARDLCPIVAPAILHVPDTGKKLSASSSVATQLVGYDHSRHVSQTLQELEEEALCCPLVAAFLHQDVKYVAVLIDRPPQVTTLAVDGDEDFVEEPRITGPSLTPSQGSSIGATELETPLPDRLSWLTVMPRSASRSWTSRKLRQNRW